MIPRSGCRFGTVLNAGDRTKMQTGITAFAPFAENRTSVFHPDISRGAYLGTQFASRTGIGNLIALCTPMNIFHKSGIPRPVMSLPSHPRLDLTPDFLPAPITSAIFPRFPLLLRTSCCVFPTQQYHTRSRNSPACVRRNVR